MNSIPGLVSVTIPFRNSARYLAEAIESVRAQTYSGWELFLVDDGSDDGSQQIAQRYARESPQQIRYLEHAGHRNLGVTRTRNIGASSSKGEFLAFLDSDDVWLPSKLETQVALLNENPIAGAVLGPSEYWYDWDTTLSGGQHNSIPDLAPGDRLYTPPELFLMTHPIGAHGAPCPSSLLLRRTAFDSIGGFVDAFHPGTYQLLEDTAFLTKLYLSQHVYVSARCTDRYRCHSDSIWHRTMGTPREEAERKFYFAWLRSYLQEKGLSDPAIVRAVRKQSWTYSLGLPDRLILPLRRTSERLRRRLTKVPR